MLAHHEILIDAPLGDVWGLHADVNAWTSWQTDISESHIDGVMEPGNSFDWTSYNFPVRSTVYDMDDRERILWGGTAGGITEYMSGCSLRPPKVFKSPRRNLSLAIRSTPTRKQCRTYLTLRSSLGWPT